MTTSHSPRPIANISPLPRDRAFRRLWTRLEGTLLALGGEQLLWRGTEPYLAELVRRGQVFDHPVRKRRGRASGCHYNAARLWARDSTNTQIATGYALSDDGRWRQHSWVIRKGKLIETTVDRLRYFGVLLDQFEALEFCEGNYLVPEYPGKLPPDVTTRYPGLLERLAEYVAARS